MAERLPPEEGGYVLCRVEGCPRTTDEGQSEDCGLFHIGVRTPGPRPLCGSDATIVAWAKAGLLDLVPQVTHDDHLTFHREAHET